MKNLEGRLIRCVSRQVREPLEVVALREPIPPAAVDHLAKQEKFHA